MDNSYDQDGFDGAGWDIDQYDPYYDDPMDPTDAEDRW